MTRTYFMTRRHLGAAGAAAGIAGVAVAAGYRPTAATAPSYSSAAAVSSNPDAIAVRLEHPRDRTFKALAPGSDGLLDEGNRNYISHWRFNRSPVTFNGATRNIYFTSQLPEQAEFYGYSPEEWDRIVYVNNQADIRRQVETTWDFQKQLADQGYRFLDFGDMKVAVPEDLFTDDITMTRFGNHFKLYFPALNRVYMDPAQTGTPVTIPQVQVRAHYIGDAQRRGVLEGTFWPEQVLHPLIRRGHVPDQIEYGVFHITGGQKERTVKYTGPTPNLGLERGPGSITHEGGKTMPRNEFISYALNTPLLIGTSSLIAFDDPAMVKDAYRDEHGMLHVGDLTAAATPSPRPTATVRRV